MDSSLVLGLLGSVVPSAVGWLLIRAVKGMDATLASLSGKVDALTNQDTQILIELAELRTRVTHLELLVRER